MQANDPDIRRVVDRVQAARRQHRALDIRGGGTKRFYGEAPRGEALDLRSLTGISSYEPTELVVTARAGTPLAELEAVLAGQGQCLAFEPPHFSPPAGAEAGGTVGGMVAAGLSGPSRASVGSLRDFLLGLTLLNGRGEIVNFGGQVMKNVAGYDISRLVAGSWGILGVILEASIKVLPVHPATLTLGFEFDQATALRRLREWSARPLPLHASCWSEGRLMLRLSGARAAVQAGHADLGGESQDPGAASEWWRSVRDHGLPIFHPGDEELAHGDCLWRLSLPANTAPLAFPGLQGGPGGQLIEWNGALRWCRSDAPAAIVRAAAAGVGGHATLVRAADKGCGAFAPLSGALLRIHREVKAAFDPDGIFNPGRLYAGL
jgi:glycolate oxidase FAD binding subunit